ncbi:DUF1707 SHOCT-like domain-containing protein [Aestuariimicrobium ganziense]|uniref:DUF1707 SHOCT-like domain-containing protein n=1 Tax=Aestuariimicrobium ganziense TaxID=2773677 RepID=UPI001943E88E|nr:DUF1707 domain-containing protein [Aestuariimicrobium ganziense]
MSGDLRASFEERDQYLDLLSKAYAEGRLDDDELNRRRDLVLRSVTHNEMLRSFDGLPQPRVKFTGTPNRAPVQIRPPQVPVSQGVNRRDLLAVAAGIAVVGGVGIMGMNVRSDSSGGPATEIADPGYPPVDPHENPLETLNVEPVIAELTQQGLTWIIEMTVTASGIKGVAHAEGQPEVASTFETVNGLVVIGSPSARKQAPSFMIDSVHFDQLWMMHERAMQVFEGQATKITFLPDGRGGAVATFTYPDGTIQFSGDGTRVLKVDKQR